MIYRVYLFSLLIIFTCCSKSTTDLAESVSYTNPLLPSGADPWVIQKDSFYYYTNTLGDRIAIWKTKSMSRLGSAENKIIWRPPANRSNSYGIWAPELHYFNNKWYMYYAAGATADNSNQGLFVLENSSPDPLDGTWMDKGKVADPSADIYAIDGTILDYNNKRYLIWSSLPLDNVYKQDIFIAEMLNPWTLATSRSVISSPQFDWEKIGTLPVNGVNEGPEVLKNPKGDIFLIFSASGCWTDGYCLGMMSLKNGGNPLNAADWLKSPEPVFSTKETSFAYGPGHNSFFKSPDGKEDWILYHANLKPKQECNANRSPRIQKFTWNADGTPNFGEPVPAFKRIKRPSGEKD